MRALVIYLVLFHCLSVFGGTLLVYDGTTGQLAPNWHNFSWATVSLTSTTYVHPGDKYSISLVCSDWKGLYLTQLNEWDIADYNTFSFWINGGDQGNEYMTVQLIAEKNSQTVTVADYISGHQIPAKTWVKVEIPLSHFGLVGSTIKGFWFQANSQAGNNPIAYFDDIQFTSSVVPPSNGPNLTVNANQGRTPINPNIYGITIFWDSSNQQSLGNFAKEIGLPLNRIGGDGTTRYNWQVDTSNSGDDWFFMGGNGNSNPVPGASVDSYISTNNQYGTKTVVTVPIISYINKFSAWHCSYPKNLYPNQQSYNPYIHPNNIDCGNGKTASGSNILDTHVLDHDIPNTPEIQKGWIQHIVSKFGTSSRSGVVYQLDNEVSNWGFMHRDVHPSAVTYEEIVNRTIEIAPVIKSVDPSAEVAGPSEIQFAWYPDWGGEKNIVYYLQAMQQYEQRNGRRLIDSYDVHYPDANDNHWPKLRDVDALKAIVDKTYPGTKISFSEWSLSGTGALNGALATADQLGYYAKNSVSFASYWGLSDPQSTIAFAYRIFLNYDGKGGKFGNTYISSTSSDDSQLNVHAATRSDGALTILVINKTGGDLKSTLTLIGVNVGSAGQVYVYSAANPTSIVSKGTVAVSNSGFTYDYEGFSLTLIVVGRG
eukprot:TRINITY_DN1123_c0_g1_i2.p1 TRINITY_DN1123_c0_g1~~TRINITY_DN1123_c0_g1_i2.p1  ORF type:complete len:670 (-),score=130.83 TRINITY_DN1123_c0_g1_i2:21-1976(-)